MSAVATAAPAPRAPMQPGLLGIDEAPSVPEIRYSLAGQVQRAVEVRVAPDGRHAHLVVQIVQPPHAGHARPPIRAVLHRPAADAAELLALQDLARRLAPGTHVLAVCRGLDVDHQRGELHAWHCEYVSPIAPAEVARYLPELPTDHPLDAPHPSAAEPHMKAA